LMFATLPRDRNPSLFIGVGSQVKKFSFGIRTQKGRDMEE
jgi:hypothetical protein